MAGPKHASVGKNVIIGILQAIQEGLHRLDSPFCKRDEAPAGLTLESILIDCMTIYGVDGPA